MDSSSSFVPFPFASTLQSPHPQSYYAPPSRDSLPLDLGHGYNSTSFVQKTAKENLDNLVKSVLVTPNASNLLATNPVHVCTWRGILTKIATAPYLNIPSQGDRNNRPSDPPFELVAAIKNKVLYIHEAPPCITSNENSNHDSNASLSSSKSNEAYRTKPVSGVDPSYFGYKFENLATVPMDPSTVDPRILSSYMDYRNDVPVDPISQHCTVFTASLGPLRLLYGAEMDATVPKTPSRKSYQVELKTSTRPKHFRQIEIFTNTKLLKFYFQSFFAGIPEIIVGYRSKNLLTDIERIRVLDIPKTFNVTWDYRVCLGFVKWFLEMVIGRVKEEAEKDGVAFRVRIHEGIVSIWKESRAETMDRGVKMGREEVVGTHCFP